MLEICSLEEAFSKKVIPTQRGRTIFILGAGISHDTPSYLPLGEELTKFYLTQSIGTEPAQKILNKWNDLSKLIYRDTGFLFPCIRLEMIIDNVNKVERTLTDRGLIQGFDYLPRIPSNTNHRLLYQLVSLGNLMLTANFDCCIENAYGELSSFRRKYEMQSISLTDGKIKIFHFHGMANIDQDPYYQAEYSLGATLETIKNGFPVDLGKFVTDCLKKEWDLVFIGYSGSDFFDVTPFFENLPQNLKGRAIFFAHGEKPNTSETYRSKKLLVNFKHPYIVYGNTTKLLRMLLEYEQSSFQSPGVNLSIDWRQGFYEIQKTRDEKARNLLVTANNIHLSNQLGFPFCQFHLDWAEQLRDMLEYFLRDKHLNLFFTVPDKSATVLADLVSACQYGAEHFPTKAQLYEKSYQQFDRIWQLGRNNILAPVKSSYNWDLENLRKYIEGNEPSPINFNSPIVFAINRIVKGNIQKWIKNPQDIVTQYNLKLLLTMINKMLSMPYYQYMYLSYYITLLKLKNFLLAILMPNEDNRKSELFMLEIAMEISCISQVIRVYRNWIMRRRLLYRITNHQLYLEESEYYYQVMTKIAKLVGQNVGNRIEMEAEYIR